MGPHGRQDRGGGREEERRGHRRTAASCFLRASRYYQTGERFIHQRAQQSQAVYTKSVNIFKEAAAAIRSPRIEPVEVPYENTSRLRCWCIPIQQTAARDLRLAWCSLNGFDVTKELQYGYGIPDLVARGVAASLSMARETAKACAFATCRSLPRPNAMPRRFTSMSLRAASSTPGGSA